MEYSEAILDIEYVMGVKNPVTRKVRDFKEGEERDGIVRDLIAILSFSAPSLRYDSFEKQLEFLEWFSKNKL